MKKQREHPVFQFGIHLLFLLSLLSFSHLSAQNASEKDQLIQIQDVTTENNSSDQTVIKGQFTSPLPEGSVVRISLYNRLKNWKVDWKNQSIKQGKQTSFTLGPYDSFWPGSYQLVVEFNEAKSDPLPTSLQSKSTFSRHNFRTSSSVPEPEQQQRKFRNQKREFLLDVRAFYLWFYPRVRSYRKKRTSGDDAENNKETLSKKTRDRLQPIFRKIKELQQQYVFGSPFEDRIQDLTELVEVLEQFIKKQLQSIVEEWKADSSRYYHMNRAQRINNQIASPEDLRVFLLQKLFTYFSGSSSPTDELYEKLQKHYRSLQKESLRILTDSSLTDKPLSSFSLPADRIAALLNETRESKKKLIQKVKNVLWLYRDLPETFREQHQKLRRGRSLLLNIQETREKLQTSTKKQAREKPAKQQLSRLLNQIVALSDRFLDDQWHLMERHITLPMQYFSFLNDRLIHIMDVDKQQTERIEEILSQINRWKQKHNQNVQQTIKLMKNNPGETGKTLLNTFSSWLPSDEEKQKNTASDSIRSFIQDHKGTDELSTFRKEINKLQTFSKKIRRNLSMLKQRYDAAYDLLKRMKNGKPPTSNQNKNNNSSRDNIFNSATSTGYINYIQRKLQQLESKFNSQKSQFNRS